jgi:serine/threonine protein kinase/tetratricopeptide (TPR) repeat protein
MSTLSDRAKELFLDALELGPADRGAFLDRACGGDAALRAEVEDLLAHHARAGTFLASAGVDTPTIPSTHTAAGGPGTAVGPYHLVEQVGEGGMGVVFVAEQSEPVRRRVALKVIKPGMDTREVVARFEAERQALALMDHPNIARVLDAGATPEGRPYFVMELVRGVRITDYCDLNRLTVRDRLGLFLQVSAAVQHAHQKGVIHRDLKPGNVLVAVHDVAVVAKVIDFGVAKAIGQTLTDKTVHTAVAQMVGTPLYMSPEQAAGGTDVDTRADVYALGVLLYELLTGTTPFDRERFRQADSDEVRRIIREEEPPKPSTRLGANGPAAANVAANRRTDPRRLSRLCHGDLDWVVMKCLEKDRDRRYESAAGLAADVRRYLADEPVLARPPSAAYRLRKVLRRNRGPVLAASVVFVSLVAGIVGTSLGLVEARRQEKAARKSADDERSARAAAVESVADSDAYADFLANHVLATPRPEGMQGGFGHNVTMEEALANTEPKLGDMFRDRPKAEALARHAFGVTWRLLGRYEKAEEHLRQALALRERQLGPQSVHTLDTRRSLAVTLVNAGRAAEGVPLLEQVAEDFSRTLGPDHPYTLSTRTSLAHAYCESGRPEKALPLLEAGLPKSRVDPGPSHPDTLALMYHLALMYQNTGRQDTALALMEEVFERRKALYGADSPAALVALSFVAGFYASDGQLLRAMELYEQILPKLKAKLGGDHPTLLYVQNEAGATYNRAGRTDRALPLLEAVHEKLSARFGADHPFTLFTANNLGVALCEANQPQKGLAMLEQVLKKRTAVLDPDHPDTLRSMTHLGDRYRADRQADRAVPLLEDGLARQQTRLGPDHPDTLLTMRCLATAYLDTNQLQKALPLFERTLRLQQDRLGPDHPETLVTSNNLAVAYQRAGRTPEALPLLERVFAKFTSSVGPDHPRTLACLSNLAGAHWRVGNRDRGRALREQSVEGHRKRFGPDHPFTLLNVNLLGVLYAELGEFDKAVPLLAEARAKHETQMGPDHPQTLLYMTNLAAVSADAGRHVQAEELLRELLDRRRRTDGPESPATADVLEILGRLLVKHEKYAEAAPTLRQCLDVRREKLPDNWRTFLARFLLGTALLGQGKHEEAEPLLAEGYEGLRQRENQIPVPGRRLVIESLERVVRLYEDANAEEQAAAWRTKLDAHKKVEKQQQ